MATPLILTHSDLQQLTAQASARPRLRQNLNLHPQLDDPIQRLFNAMEPGTYVRPHRHDRDNGWELMLLVSGAFAILLFDEAGTIVGRVELSAEGARAVEIPPRTWHAVVSLQPGTVMFEVKPGPYSPVADKDFAAWAPTEATPECARLTQWYAAAQPGDRPPQLLP